MEIFNHLFGFLIDKNRRLSSKAILVIIGIASVLMLNDVTGFTYYYNTKNKLEQVKLLNDILKDSTLTKTNRQQAVALQARLLRHQSITSKLSTSLADTYTDFKVFVSSYTKQTKATPSSPNTESITIARVSRPRNNFLYLLSTSGLLMLMGVLMIPTGIIVIFQENTATGVSVMLIAGSFFGFLSFIFYYLLNLIPAINGGWGWNYLINVMCQLGICGLFVWLIIKVANEKKTVNPTVN